MKTTKTRRYIIALAGVVAALALALAGCSSGAGSTSETPQGGERIVILGEITETIGNMITLNLVDANPAPLMSEEQMQAMREMMEQNGGEFPRFQFREGESLDGMTREEMIERYADMIPEEMRDRLTEGLPENWREQFADGMPENWREQFANGMPEDMQQFADMIPEDMREEMRERFAEGGGGFQGSPRAGGRNRRNYTGETKEIIIPAGAPILETTTLDGVRTETEISLDKLKSGDIIEVTYASDNQTVAKVTKQPQTATPRRGGNPGGGGNFGGGRGFQTNPDGSVQVVIPG